MEAMIFPPIVGPACPGSDLAVPSDLVDMSNHTVICPDCGRPVPVALSGQTGFEGGWIRDPHSPSPSGTNAVLYISR
jgi:hypothetical protein